MTIKSRNRFFLLFIILTFLLLASYVGEYIAAYLAKNIVPPENTVRILNIFPKTLIFGYNFYASIGGILCFVLYAAICSIYVLIGFEKTQSYEVVYFFYFLASCLMESIRIILPLTGIWRNFLPLLEIIGRIVYCARFMAPLTFLFASLFSETEFRQIMNRNILTIILLSIFAAMIVPIDTVRLTSTCTLIWGFKLTFVILRILIFVATLASMFINAYQKDNAELKRAAVGYIFIALGYSVLILCDNFVFLGISIPCLAVGTVVYMQGIHNTYLWR